MYLAGVLATTGLPPALMMQDILGDNAANPTPVFEKLGVRKRDIITVNGRMYVHNVFVPIIRAGEVRYPSNVRLTDSITCRNCVQRTFASMVASHPSLLVPIHPSWSCGR